MLTNVVTASSDSSRPRTKEIIDPSEKLVSLYCSFFVQKTRLDYPLLQEHAESIKSIKRETFQYGLTEIHQVWYLGTFSFFSWYDRRATLARCLLPSPLGRRPAYERVP